MRSSRRQAQTLGSRVGGLRHSCCAARGRMVRIPYRILIVEDHEAARRGLEMLLTNAGYVVFAASTYAEGRRSLDHQAPDLLIADVRLGEYNGLQLIATAPLAIPSIIVTGYHDPF